MTSNFTHRLIFKHISNNNTSSDEHSDISYKLTSVLQVYKLKGNCHEQFNLNKTPARR